MSLTTFDLCTDFSVAQTRIKTKPRVNSKAKAKAKSTLVDQIMLSRTFSRSYKQRVSLHLRYKLKRSILNVAGNHQEFHNDQNFNPQMRFN